MHERLLIIRNGQERTRSTRPLRHGADGNVQTLREAADMVREDSATDDRLRQFVESLVSGCAPHDAQCEVSKLFEFARDEIRYVEDPPGIERIADAWATIQDHAGDCGDKAILLASMLGVLGYQSQFIVQNFNDDVLDHGFDHVHIEGFMPDGTTLQLDPTERSGVMGWEAPSVVRMRFPIWSDDELHRGLDRRTGAGDIWSQIEPSLIQSGVQFGSSYAQSSLQQSRQSATAQKQINSQWESLVRQVNSVFQAVSAKLPASVTSADLAAAVQAYQALESYVAQYPTDYVLRQWNSDAYKTAYLHDLGIYQNAVAAPATTAPVTTGGLAPSGQVPGAGSPSSGVSTFVESLSSQPLLTVSLIIAAMLLLRR